MDLSGIGTIAAAVVAAVGIPTALMVGRWQERGQINSARETAVSEREQWRRSLRRDAYVAFLLATTETDSIDALELVIQASEPAIDAAEAAVKEARHRSRTAFHILQIESPELADVAGRLMAAAQLRAGSEVAAARAMHADAALERLERAGNIEFTEVRAALRQVRELHRTHPSDDMDVDGARRGAAVIAARRAIGEIGGLSEGERFHLLASVGRDWSRRRWDRELDDARSAFLTAVHSSLNDEQHHRAT